MSTIADGGASTPLLSTPVLTDENGVFAVNAYTCPSASSQLYIVSIDGNPGLSSDTNNLNLAEMALLGPCGGVSSSTSVIINEITTVAAAYALSPFINSYAAVGSSPADAPQLDAAITVANELANFSDGSTPGAALPPGQIAPVAKLMTLADVLAACVNSSGGTANDGTVCGDLFADTSLPANTPPANTIDASLEIARNPANSVSALYFLSQRAPPFGPILTAPPADWTLQITSDVPTPIMFPTPGTFNGPQGVTLTDSNPSAKIYYTLDGSPPSTSSTPYSGAISVSASTTIRAIAVANGVGSLLALGSYAITPAQLVFVTSPTAGNLGSALSPSPAVAVENANGSVLTAATGIVTLQLANNSAGASLSGTTSASVVNGIATFPNLVVSTAGSGYTLTAISPGMSAGTSSPFSVANPVSVTVTPGSATLTPSQTQQFAATVANNANTAVTWSLSPAVGSISSAGLYTAPALIASQQMVTVTAVSAADKTKAASVNVSLTPPAATYYLSPTGTDGNNGRSSSTPWLTPNHPLNCGDVIIASGSAAYAASNFTSGKWGNVTCLGSNNVAWLKCATFDACKIHVTSGTADGMRVSASFWGVQGWEVSNTAGGTLGGNCFNAVPPTPTQSIHHIIFANDIANVCPLDGFAIGPYGVASVDYWVAVGNIAYSAGVSNTYCGSGISAYEPAATDTLPGTHIYVAGNFSFSNTNPSGCYDGNGIIFDTFDGDQTSMPVSYSQQSVIDNNISLSNGAVGVRIEYNNAGNGPNHATIYARHNTMWNNNSGTSQYGNPTCGEMQLYETLSTHAYLNLAATAQAGCYGDPQNPAYAYSMINEDGTSSAYQNFEWSATGSYTQMIGALNFILGTNNITNSNPNFSNPTTPGAPICGTNSSVPDCMAPVISNFTPKNAAAVGYGYQVPGSAQTYDPLFPQWLCTVNLPAGMVTMGCLPQQ